MHSNVCSLLLKRNVPRNQRPSRAVLSQLAGIFLNLPVFSLALTFFDRRIAVLWVRLWNRFLFFLTLPLLLSQLDVYFGLEKRDFQFYILVTILFFGIYPGPLNPGVGKSLFFSAFDHKHIWRGGQINSLFRSFVLETVFPVFLLLLVVSVYLFNSRQLLWFFLFSLFTVLVSCSLYAPMGISLSILIAFLNFQAIGIYGSLADILLMIIILGVTRNFIHGDEFGKEVLEEAFQWSSVLRFGFWNITEFIVICLTPSLLLFFDISSTRFTLFVLFFGVFSVFNFTQMHNFSRIWFRGALPFYQLSIVLLCARQLRLSEMEITIGWFLCFLLYLIYFINQTGYLLNVGYFKAPPDVDLEGLISSRVTKQNQEAGGRISTNPNEIMLSGLYSDSFTQNVVHGVGALGYEQQICNLAMAFRTLGHSKEQFIETFSLDVDYFSWLRARNENNLDSVSLEEIAIYQLQFLCTYMTYNYAMIQQGYRENGKWTPEFKARLASIWDSGNIF